MRELVFRMAPGAQGETDFPLRGRMCKIAPTMDEAPGWSFYLQPRRLLEPIFCRVVANSRHASFPQDWGR